MNEIFLKVINMSISASWLVLAVLVLRLLLKKAPKWVNVLLWSIVAVRLICPYSVESALSLIPSAQTVPMNIEMDATPAVDTGIDVINSMVNPVISASFAPQPAASANPLQIWIPVASILWIAGVAGMLLYTAISYWRLRYKVRTAVLYRDNIFQSEYVGSPFVLGIFRPRIYLPFKIDAKDLELVVAHEQAHIRRKDHWWKPLGFFLLAIHWFNPLVWLAYILLCRDIELACDEKVIKELGNEEKADYTQALLGCSVNRRNIAACPLAFGEVGVKERVKSVMNYKKPAFWVIILAVVVCIAVAVCFLTNPVEDDFDVLEDTDDIIGTVSAGDNMDRLRTQNGDVLIIQNNGGTWHFNKDQEVPVEITFANDGSNLSMKSVGYIYCGDGAEGLYANEIFSNQTVNSATGMFTAPESGNYLFYFRNYSASWIELESFMVGYYFEAEVLEIHDNYFLVEPVADSTERKSSDRIEVPMKNMDPSLEPQVGDIIEIRYSGEILETYPARLGEVYSIRVTQEDEVWDKRPMIMMDGSYYVNPYMPVSQLPYGYTLAGTLTQEQAYNTGLEGNQYYQNPNAGDFYVYQLCGTPIDINTVDTEQLQWAYVRWIPVNEEAVTERKLTLDDVRMLSEKGQTLTWSDFDLYKYVEGGSGLYIRIYEIDELFELWIGGAGPDSDPMYIYLTLADDIDTRIDIRDGGVTEFISRYNVDPVEEEEEVWDLSPMVMVDGQLYQTTGLASQRSERADGFDGEITSEVAGSERPTKNDQSNFGTGYGYQYGTTEGTLEIFIDEKWWLFVTEEGFEELFSDRPEREEPQYNLRIGAGGTMLVEIEMPNFGGSVQKLDGTVFEKGDWVELRTLDGCADLRGLEITAFNEDGEIIWSASIPDTEENEGFTYLKNNDWEITNIP